MTILELLQELRDEWGAVPRSKEGEKLNYPSNSELRRWITKHCVKINGVVIIDPAASVQFPVTDLVFFPKSETSRCSIWTGDYDEQGQAFVRSEASADQG